MFCISLLHIIVNSPYNTSPSYFKVLPPCNERGSRPKRLCPESCIKQKGSICFQDITFGNSQFREWYDSLDCEEGVNIDDCWNMTIPSKYLDHTQ